MDADYIWHLYIEELFNQRHLELIEAIFSPSYILNGEACSVEQIRATLQVIFNAFPDCYLAVDEQFTRDDCVIAMWTLHGTHLGDFQGRPATGRTVRLPGSSMVHIQKGKVVKEWRHFDEHSLATQIN